MVSDIFHFPWEEIIFIAFSEATRYYDFILYIQQNLILPSGFSCKILLLAMVHWTVTMKASSWNMLPSYFLSLFVIRGRSNQWSRWCQCKKCCLKSKSSFLKHWDILDFYSQRALCFLLALANWISFTFLYLFLYFKTNWHICS